MNNLKFTEKQATSINICQSYVSSILKKDTLNNNSLTKLLFAENNNYKLVKGFREENIYGGFFSEGTENKVTKKEPYIDMQGNFEFRQIWNFIPLSKLDWERTFVG